MANKASAPANVEEFLSQLDHPLKPEILAVRQVILGADPRIAEEIKWNAPSFRTAEHFATMNLRAKSGLLVILHRGAKPRDSTAGMTIHDPGGLLEWLGPDRASVLFRDVDEVAARREAFAAIIRQWLEYV